MNINADGTPNTALLVNPVPFIYVTENNNAMVQNHVLADATLRTRKEAISCFDEF